MHVDIVPIGGAREAIIRQAAEGLRSAYDTEVSVHDARALPSDAYVSSRGQYRAESLIELAGRVGDAEKNIAITDEDLFYQRRNYVFGLAYLGGTGSVVSTYRLQSTTETKVAADGGNGLFDDRIRKEVVHEIGHTLGLEHCDDDGCVMNFSPTVREVDVKADRLCTECRNELGDQPE